MTRTSGVFEREPSWSPDGKSIAYFSDATGEYKLYVVDVDASSGPRQLTRTSLGFKSNPVWSPDSTRIAFVDHTNSIFIHMIAANETRGVDADEWGAQPQVKWSPDSKWLVYNKLGDNAQRSLWLYNTDTRAIRRINSGRFDDYSPTFDRDARGVYDAGECQFRFERNGGRAGCRARVGGGGDLEQAPSIQIGMLAADFELHNGAFRITRVHEGGPWDTNGRGPLSQPAVNVKPGDYLLAVNGKLIDAAKDPWAALVGMAGVETTLTVSDNRSSTRAREKL